MGNVQYSHTLDIMMSAASFLSVSLIIGQAWSARDLFSVRSPLSRSLEPCCDHTHVLSCVEVEVDPEVLLNDHDISINNVTLLFSNFIPPHARTYKTAAGDEAVISYNAETGSITGTLHTEDGHVFALEQCGDSYIFEEFDVDSFPEDNATVEYGPDDNSTEVPVLSNTTMMRSGAKTYSIMFYYTPEFAAATPNIADYLDQVVAEMNQGYANSKIDITVTKFCQELATVSEATTSDADMLEAFRDMKGTGSEGRKALRNTADAAHLMVLKNTQYCGVAYLAKPMYGWTVGVTQKPCALGHYTVGHELGHNFGAHHDTRVASNNIFSYGHGQLIEKGSASTGYNSIMAYGTTGYRRKANYYSNPDVIFPGTGTPTGVAGVSNNAKVLNEMIGQMAALGDESGTCGYVPPSTTTTTTAPTTTTAASCVINESSYICAGNNALDSKKVADWQECANHCASIASCEAWTINKWNRCWTKTSASCYGSHKNWTWGTKQCGNAELNG